MDGPGCQCHRVSGCLGLDSGAPQPKIRHPFHRSKLVRSHPSLKRSSTFFYSRIATTAYSALNTVILDMISASGATVGYYSSADRLITTGRSALSPISDSLYPYMVKNRDFKLVRKILLILNR